jgi:murein DD-endopeptidase MepM/ murein hydrolase activator NlpD
MMKKSFLYVAPLYLAAALMAPACALAWSLPLQMELRVPFDPTAFPSAGRTFLMYELYLTNFSDSTIDLRRIEVVDADEPAGKPVAAFEGEQIDSQLQSIGSQSSTDKSNLRRMNAGATVAVFMQVTFDARARVPNKLRHRVLTADSSVEGAVVDTHRTELKVLVPPVRGAVWHAYDGPSNDRDNHHRRGLLVMEGRPSISRRYATDWFLIKDGAPFKEDARDGHTDFSRDRRAYYSYGQPVFAVAGGTVVMARDGMPDNVSGPPDDFQRAVPITLETATGNTVIVDLGGGQFAHYYHLQPGSLRKKAGDRVRSGDVLARIGVSGDPNVPHLHFEVTTSAKPLAGEGVPYVIDQYRVKTADDSWQTYTRELPMRNMLVDFGQTDRDAN